MGNNTNTNDTGASAAASSSRLGMRNNNNNVIVGGGEIVEVQGGHIVRSTGRKDRHSKVCTAKGPRDRRVRLSAHTAIQFYDVQDRLGYDRPSKAVDWLIKKAKAAIDELDELPAWNPISSAAAAAAAASAAAAKSSAPTAVNSSVTATGLSDAELNLQSQMMEQGNNNHNSGFLPPSLDSDVIADTIKSFFPIASEESHQNHSHHPPVSSPIQFHHHSYPPDLLSRTSTSQSQDLRLSLQSFQDPILLQHHQAQAQHAQHNEHTYFSGFGWSDHHQHHQNPAEFNRFQRIVFNNNGGNDSGGGGGDGEFVFNSTPLFSRGGDNHNHHNNNQFFSFQRGPLQSSNTPSVRAWIDNSTPSSTSMMSSIAEHQIPHSLSGMGFIPGAGGGGFSGFHHNIPARIQGEEEHDGISDKPSSASSDSRH